MAEGKERSQSSDFVAAIPNVNTLRKRKSEYIARQGKETDFVVQNPAIYLTPATERWIRGCVLKSFPGRIFELDTNG
jgi:hypothetical protein